MNSLGFGDRAGRGAQGQLTVSSLVTCFSCSFFRTVWVPSETTKKYVSRRIRYQPENWICWRNTENWNFWEGTFYRLKVCALPCKLICWNLLPNVMVFEGVPLGGYQSRALRNRIGVLIQGTPESSLTPSLLWRHRKRQLSVNQDVDPARHEPATPLILDFPVSKTVRNKCLLFVSRSVCAFCSISPSN